MSTPALYDCPTPSSTILKVERSKKKVDFKKILAILLEENIISRDFTGDLRFEINQGGISRCQKLETIR